MIGLLRMIKARITTLDECRSAGISVSAYSFPNHSKELYTLEGAFRMIRGPVLTSHGEAEVVINQYDSHDGLAHVDNVHGNRWTGHSDYLFRTYFNNDLNRFANEKKPWEIRSNGKNVLCAIETEWSRSNIFHALFDAFGKLAVLEIGEELAGCSFLVNEKSKFLESLLQLFKYSYVVYPDNTPLIGAFKIPSMTHRTGHITPMLRKFLARQRDRVGILDRSSNRENLYIARKGARAVLNEEQVLSEISRHISIRKIYLEDMKFLEQFCLIAQSNYVIAPHGAGMSWCVFKDSGAVLELVSPNYDNRCFSGIESEAVHFYRCEPALAESPSNGSKSDPFKVDLNRLSVALDRMLSADPG